MGVDCEEVGACWIAASHDEVGSDVTLVAEQMLLEHCHAGNDTRLTAGGEGMQFEVGGDEGGCEFGVCCCTGSGTPDLRGDVVEFLAVLDQFALVQWIPVVSQFLSSIPYPQRWARLLLVYLQQ